MDLLKLNCKIALRNLNKSAISTCINIGGIALAITAFIIVVLYVRYERNFDATNPNYENIYLVGRDLPNNVTGYTSPELAKKIKEVCPEVELVGKIKYTNFEFAVSSNSGRFYLKNVLSVDYDAYKIFNFQIDDTSFKSKERGERSFFLSANDYKTLFPKNEQVIPEMVAIGDKAFGQTAKIDGVFIPNGHSNFKFDGLAIADDISFEMAAADQSNMTFIQVKPTTDIANLEKKINSIYKNISLNSVAESKLAGNKANLIYLDPLKNLHLQPRTASSDNKNTVDGVLYLGISVLLLGCINSINMNVAQSTKRAKEIGMKKVMGATRNAIALQFMLEVFVQCSIAAILGLIIVEAALPAINNALYVKLSIGIEDASIFWLIPLILLVTTIVTGIYPAFILSSIKPALILKGNFDQSSQGQWIKKAFLILQFSIAMSFIIGLLIIRNQLHYMQTYDRGFSAQQVISVRNQAIFDKEEKFKPVKEKILKINGVKSVTVASHIPTNPKATSALFSIEGEENYFSVVNVGFDYFETLQIKLADGRYFSEKFGLDTTSAVILNEAAIKEYHILNPIGKTIRGCNTTFKIVGVIKDFKSEGFEKAVEPTLYSINKVCGDTKAAIMVKVEQNRAAEVIDELKGSWSTINKLDGEDFRYDFIDGLYNKIFERQERMQFIITCLSIITILIALFGIYAYAKFMTNVRRKEIAIRRILGAEHLQIVSLLNLHFTWLIILSNVIAILVVYITANKWLESFAYKLDLSATPFVLTSIFTTVLIVCTVSYQAYKSMKTPATVVLKSE